MLENRIHKFVLESRDEDMVRRRQKADEMLASFDGKSGILAGQWSDLKMYANRYLEVKFEVLEDLYFWPIYRERQSRLTDFYNQRVAGEMEHNDWEPQLHTFTGKAKKFSASQKSPLYKNWNDALAKMFQEEARFVERVNSWKDKIVKKVPGEKKAKEKAEVQRILKSNKDVSSVVEMIAEQFRKQVQDQYLKYWKDLIDKAFPGGQIYVETKEARQKHHMPVAVGRYGTLDNPTFKDPNHHYKLKNDWQIELQKASEVETDAVLEAFVQKLVFKLNTILQKKGNLQQVEKVGTPGKNEISMEFGDGSKFMVKSQIVYGYSSLGHAFSRYPTTFHDVFLPGGIKMSNPSEERMVAVFSVTS